MAQVNTKDFSTLPVGRLGLIPLQSCSSLGAKVNDWLVKWRAERQYPGMDSFAFEGYKRDSYIIDAKTPRFGSGEGKCTINESVRGDDIYVMVDVTNYSLSYPIGPYTNLMSPDDHFQDMKRVIAAVGGKARRVNVIMPYLYESRQDKRVGRESLDCANALHELIDMGVENIITFDAHDPRVQNAIPLNSFETVQPTYQFIKALLKNVPDLKVDADHLMVISPDEGAMNRTMYFSSVLGVDIGMFYKRRDYSVVVDGRNPIVAHEFLGSSVEGKDVMIIDDMISSGESMLDVARELKRRKARRVFCISTFGMFTNGLESFDKAYEEGLIYKVITTNCTYQRPDLFERPWYVSCDVAKYIALLIDSINHEASISAILNPHDRITKRLEEYKQFHTIKEEK